MDMADTWVVSEGLPLGFQILAGVSLAACCGLRAFLPLFVVGMATRFGLGEMLIGRALQLNDTFEWMSTTPALVVFGVAVVAEVLGDKVPAVDNVLDMAQTWVRPIAGAVAMASSLEGLDPLWASVMGLVMGGSTAGAVHVAKSQLRLVSTFTTAGFASPLISIVEDVVALFGSLLAVLLAGLAAVLLALFVVVVLLAARRLRRRSIGADPQVATPS